MKFSFLQAVVGAALSVSLGTAGAAAIITNGTVKLGVDDAGQLNVPGGVPSVPDGETVVGVRLITAAGEFESTSHGCLCEGWGAADASGTPFSGSANNDDGAPAGMTLVSFGSDATTATSVVDISDGVMGGRTMRVTHAYAPAPETANLYEAVVTIENIGMTAIGDLRYRRVMDWDVEPTTFDEFVTIAGWPATALLGTTDNGFASADPLDSPGTDIGGCGVDVNFTRCGDFDHGALFDFGFGALAVGDTETFSIYYGGAETEAGTLAALAAVGAEVYSLGQCDPETSSTPSCGDRGDGTPDGTPVTFAFGFSGVGGTPVRVPEPASMALLGGALFGLAGVVRRRRRS